MSGVLYIVSTPIGNLADFSLRAGEVLRAADIVACEDTRHTGRLLEHVGIRARRLMSLHAHNEVTRVPSLVEALLSGLVVALVSDAGTPALSDPGEALVAGAIVADIPVRAVPGPSAVLAALVVSGIPAPRWRFEGFLPRKGAERRDRISEIASATYPSVCYEAPTRLLATLDDLAGACSPDRNVAVARELTKLYEEVWRGSLGEAISRAREHAPRGEHVLVVAGAPASERPGNREVVAMLGQLAGSGISRRDAVVVVQALLGATRKDAYDASLLVWAAAERAGEGPPDPAV